jgi:MoaA/NifB/PqqE/SkfB family radical SAM enzyme
MKKYNFWFEIESDCNLNCMFCYNHWKSNLTEKPARMKKTEIINLLDKLIKNSLCRHIVLSGGEPFFRKDIIEIAAYINNSKTKFSITTNGTLISDEDIIKIKVMEYLDTIVVPFHSHKEATHNYISGYNGWERIVELIILLKECDINVVPVFVCTKININDIADVLEMCHILKLDSIIFNRAILGGNALGNIAELAVSDQEFNAALERLGEVSSDLGIKVVFGTPITQNAGNDLSKYTTFNLTKCPVSHNQERFTIDSSGNLKACNHTHLIIGNLIKQDFSSLLKSHAAFATTLNTVGGNCLAEPGGPLSYVS